MEPTSQTASRRTTPRPQRWRYRAFLSYSSSADARFVRVVQDGLQKIGRRWNQRRALDVYLDRTDLDVSPQLWPSILKELDRSEHFVLLASPTAAASAGVRKEISHWLQSRGSENFLIVLTEGEMVWDERINGFSPTATTALPQEALRCFPIEPKWADVRALSRNPASSWRNAELHDELAGIAATIHGKPKRDLLRQERNTARITKLALAGLGLSLLIFTAIVARNLYSHSTRYQIREIVSAPIEGPLSDSEDLAKRRRTVPPSVVAAGIRYFAALAVVDDDKDVYERIARIQYPFVQGAAFASVARMYDKLSKPQLASRFSQASERAFRKLGTPEKTADSAPLEPNGDDEIEEALQEPDDLAKVKSLAALARRTSALRSRAASLARSLVAKSRDDSFRCQALSAWIRTVKQADEFPPITEVCAKAVRDYVASTHDVCMRLTTLGEALAVADRGDAAAPVLRQAAEASKFLQNSYYRGFCAARAATSLAKIGRSDDAGRALEITLAHAANVTDGVSLSRLRTFLIEPLARVGRYEEARKIAELCNPEDRLQAYGTILMLYVYTKYPKLALEEQWDVQLEEVESAAEAK